MTIITNHTFLLFVAPRKESSSFFIIVFNIGPTGHRKHNSIMTVEIDHEATQDDSAEASKPLGERVIEAIQNLPDRTIRPARLAALLGISVNEACAELCGLMAAVGGGADGATFTFEKMTAGEGQQQHVMVFTFPADFAQRALQNRRREERWQDLQDFLGVVVRGLKIVTAFGLILSLLILLIAAVAGVVAVLIASQNDRGGGGGRGRNALVLRQLHSLFYTFRQLLWCYALFGPDMGDDQQDPFLRETAYDLALICSVCCGNPGSMFFWFRARQLSNRRHRIYRGWSSTRSGAGRSSGVSAVAASRGGSEGGAYGVEGVTLVRHGAWGEETIGADSFSSSLEHRGLLSVAVEFLFGPTPFHPPQTEADKWKLRGAVIVQTCSKYGGISLAQLAPYADDPPASRENTARIVQQGLLQVAFLNGLPKETEDEVSEKSQAVFFFPELMAESSTVLRYEPRPEELLDGSFLSTLYANNDHTGRRLAQRRTAELPKFLREPYYQFTKLASGQFMYCFGLGLLNAVGVFWFAQSLRPTGALGPFVRGTIRTILTRGLLPVLSFYAKLFFLLPTGRLILVNYLNYVRRRRNANREMLSKELGASLS